MNATELITRLRSNGRSITVGGAFIDISPAGGISLEMVEQLKKSKPEILCALHQEAELERLVRLVSDHHSFSQEDYEEALQTALNDQVQALICFTSLADKAGLL
ncbi:MAG: hypothetical protein ACQ9ET_00815 [Nitrosomonadaceae bacterium]